MHSPLPGSPMFLAWQLEAELQRQVVTYLVGYIAVAVILFVWGAILPELEVN